MNLKEKKYLREKIAYAKRMKRSASNSNTSYAFGFWSGVESLIQDIDEKFRLGILEKKDKEK